jgi:NTE family protein
MKRRVALALSGGAAYGMAHLGVIGALEEAGIEVAGIAGTSVGSLVGALYAFGADMDEVRAAAEDIDWSDITRPILPRLGLLSLNRLREWLRGQIGERDISESPVPLRIVATDLAAGEGVVFARGPVDEAVAASCAIPGIFAPVEKDGRLLVDGGLVNNLPVRLARSLGVGPVVASDLLAPGSHPMPSNLLEVVIRSTNLVVGMASAREREEADLLIAPRLGDFNSADLSNSAELVREGARAGRRALKAAGWTDPS